MAEIHLKVVPGKALVPAFEVDREVVEKWKLGDIIKVKASRPRNPKFHRKAFALFNLCYDYFEPEEVDVNGKTLLPEKDFDEFRRWMTIKAGYFHVVGYPDGSVRVRAKSISFAKMDEDTFDKLYNALINVALKILPNYNDEYELKAVLTELEGFM